MVRSLVREFRRFPATMTICALWVVVYVLMALAALWQNGISTSGGLLLGSVGGHRFGDLTVGDLYQGEVWRTLTATFIHYNLLHIGMNLFGMYQLGCLVESWYGPSQFLLLYVAIGGGGNAISGLIRHELHSDPRIHSGGGSTVLLGLVALCAVVGWRAKSRVGDYLRGQMVNVLIFTALLGLLPIIDNWGHLGGAIVGGLIGLGHRFLVRNASRPSARWAGGLGAVLLLASAAAQFVDDRAEAPARARLRLEAYQKVVADLDQVYRSYWIATQPRMGRAGAFMPVESRKALDPAFGLLESTRWSLDREPTVDDFGRLRELLERARAEPPSSREVREFGMRYGRLLRQAAAVRRQADRDYQAVLPRGRKQRGAASPSSGQSVGAPDVNVDKSAQVGIRGGRGFQPRRGDRP